MQRIVKTDCPLSFHALGSKKQGFSKTATWIFNGIFNRIFNGAVFAQSCDRCVTISVFIVSVLTASSILEC
jgi:hypothetical protein